MRPVIDLGALVGDAGEGKHVVFDETGRRMENRPLPDEPALLLSRPVTDAVKQADGDRLGPSLDREGLVWVEGFALKPDLLRALGRRQVTANELIEAVRAVGLVWTVIDIESF